MLLNLINSSPAWFSAIPWVTELLIFAPSLWRVCERTLFDISRFKSSYNGYEKLKELRNCILCTIGVWSLFFFSTELCKSAFSTYFSGIGLRLSVFWFFMLLFLWFLLFIFSVLCFEFNVIKKVLLTFFNFVLTLFKRSVKI